jgi:hypothetical protein
MENLIKFWRENGMEYRVEKEIPEGWEVKLLMNMLTLKNGTV